MMKIRKAKSPKQVHFRLGWDERIFFLNNIKQQTNTLFEQMRSRRNINDDPIAANQSMCRHWVP